MNLKFFTSNIIFAIALTPLLVHAYPVPSRDSITSLSRSDDYFVARDLLDSANTEVVHLFARSGKGKGKSSRPSKSSTGRARDETAGSGAGEGNSNSIQKSQGNRSNTLPAESSNNGEAAPDPKAKRRMYSVVGDRLMSPVAPKPEDNQLPPETGRTGQGSHVTPQGPKPPRHLVALHADSTNPQVASWISTDRRGSILRDLRYMPPAPAQVQSTQANQAPWSRTDYPSLPPNPRPQGGQAYTQAQAHGNANAQPSTDWTRLPQGGQAYPPAQVRPRPDPLNLNLLQPPTQHSPGGTPLSASSATTATVTPNTGDRWGDFDFQKKPGTR